MNKYQRDYKQVDEDHYDEDDVILMNKQRDNKQVDEDHYDEM